MAPTLVDNRRIYSLPMLVTTWVLSILCELAVIAVAALDVYGSASINRYAGNYCIGPDEQYGDAPCTGVYPTTRRANATLISSSVVLTFATIFVIMHIIQISLYAEQKLSPGVNFGFNISRFSVWTVILVWIIVGYALYIINLSIVVVVVPVTWALYLIAIIYSSIIFHRARKGEYDSPVAAYGQQQFWVGQPAGIPGQTLSIPPQPYFFPGQVPFIAGQAQLVPGQPCPTCGNISGTSTAPRHNIQEHYQPDKQESSSSNAQTT